MLLFLCFLIELLLIVLLYTKQSFTLNLFSFILYTIIGFVMMTYHCNCSNDTVID